jgi:3-methylcrotonyl-CoA carboxylase alpha subunit
MIRSLLIANRGEIACRIARTCRALGVRSVAVFSDADVDGLHVALADEAIRLGAAPAAESYLRIDRLIEAARRTGADAIHPGYGFLAENPAFARAVVDAGLIFVGPTAQAMERLGDKDRAKALAGEAGLPVIAGYDGPVQSPDRLAAEARKLGFPLLVKAVAGGGGRGMRKVRTADELEEALEDARGEAVAAFGRGELLLERLVERPRHIEVQVLGDGAGGAVHLFERDCTLQRRHQKVIEEAPAPGLTDDMRAALGDAAVRLCRAARYGNAGTVEFLLEPDGRFWFIEMNTRLQVEHPVTEMVTGVDLVEQQLTLAAGEPLNLRQEDLVLHGHAIEARLYAEDPARGFVPSTGRLATCRFPPPSAGLRIETGVREGDGITSFYDPLLAKLVACGATRPAALDRLAAALDATVIGGPATNLGFLGRLCRREEVRAASVHTTWLDEQPPAFFAAREAAAEDLFLAAAALIAEAELDAAGARSPWDRADGWRLDAPARRTIRFAQPHEEITALGPLADLTLLSGSQICHLSAGRDEQGLRFERNGRVERLVLHRMPHYAEMVRDGQRMRLLLETGTVAGDAAGSADGRVMALMPGRIVRVAVGEGQAVQRGQLLMVIEAMKMEHRLAAPNDGVVTGLAAAVGQQVEEGAVLAAIRPAEEAPTEQAEEQGS